MKKKRVTAGSVEELLEIVKAVQNGEEPDEALDRMRAESAPLVDSPKSTSKKHENEEFLDEDDTEVLEEEETEEEKDVKSGAIGGALSKGKNILGKSKSKKAKPIKKEKEERSDLEDDLDDIDEDEFDRILDEEDEKTMSFQPVIDQMKGHLETLGGAVSGIGNKVSGTLAKRKEDAAAARAEKEAAKAAEKEAAREARAAEKEAARKEAVRAEREAQAAAQAEEESKISPKSAAEDTEEAETEVKTASVITAEAEENEDQEKISETAEDTEKPVDSGDDPEEEDFLDEEDYLDEEDLEEKTSVKKLFKKKPAKEKIDKKKPAKEKPVKEKSEKDNPLKKKFSEIKERGLSRKEIGIIAAAAVVLVAGIIFFFKGITFTMEDKNSIDHITADEGLRVTLAAEPESWCNKGLVELKFRVPGQEITNIRINDVDYVPGETGSIVMEAETNMLVAQITTAEQTYNARIDVEKIDAQAPIIEVTRSENMIAVNSADGRSGVAQIKYAAVHDGDYMQLPVYVDYTEPFTYESGTLYYFYAQDRAGNRSVPVVTTTEKASEIQFGKESMTIYPGASDAPGLKIEPEKALLNNLRYESADTNVAYIDEAGIISAVGEGETIIRATADGVAPAECKVLVSKSRQVTISALGDCTLGTDASFNTTTNFDAFYIVNGPSYFFKNVTDILENDDATFANFEGTLTKETTRSDKIYAFKGDPAYAEILKNASIDVVTLANNHSNDYGPQSTEDTKMYLKEQGIDYCQDDEIVVKDVNGISTAFIGIYELIEFTNCENRMKTAIDAAKAQGAQLIIVAFHWGNEKDEYPDEAQQYLGHSAIDYGADLVVGHHSHVLQGIEKYNGKYIVYSLANFCFGGNTNPADLDTIIFRQTFTVSKDKVEDTDDIEIIPCMISTAPGYNNYQPVPATGADSDRIMEKLNTRSSNFGTSFTASTGLKEEIQP